MYFDLINKLETIESSALNNNLIDELNTININLSVERYNRFISNLCIVIRNRLVQAYDNFYSNLNMQSYDDNHLSLGLSSIIEENNYLFKLSSITLVKDDTKKEIISSIKKSNNNFIGMLQDNIGESKEFILKEYLYKEDE